MSHLTPCPECNRHVRIVERVCPFCACTLALAATPEPRLPRTRLGRSATFAFGASLLSAAGVTACKDNTLPAPIVTETPAPVPIYGAPPVPPLPPDADADAAPPDPNSGSGGGNHVGGNHGGGGAGGVASIASASAGAPAVVRHPAPIYGAPPPRASAHVHPQPSKRVTDDP